MNNTINLYLDKPQKGKYKMYEGKNEEIDKIDKKMMNIDVYINKNIH